MKIAVTVCDAVHMVNTGADLVRKVRVFDLPADIAAYIGNYIEGNYTTVSFAIVDEGR